MYFKVAWKKQVVCDERAIQVSPHPKKTSPSPPPPPPRTDTDPSQLFPSLQAAPRPPPSQAQFFNVERGLSDSSNSRNKQQQEEVAEDPSPTSMSPKVLDVPPLLAPPTVTRRASLFAESSNTPEQRVIKQSNQSADDEKKVLQVGDRTGDYQKASLLLEGQASTQKNGVQTDQMVTLLRAEAEYLAELER
jgi:hypothetical protein